MAVTSERDGAIGVLTVDFPPVNALPAQGWFDLAEALHRAGADPQVHVVVLRAEGRGFNAGVDIKEIQRDAGHDALVAANRGCAAAFAAVYDCAVPVIAAVHGFCLGGGIGLVGNSDVVVAAERTEFGLPEVERGALGAATHLARLVPQHMMRTLYYTARNVSAETLHHHGSVHEVTAREDLDRAALDLARDIADKDPRVIRRAKQAINCIDPQPVHRDYRFEQGFTFEVNLLGAAEQAREQFLGGQR